MRAADAGKGASSGRDLFEASALVNAGAISLLLVLLCLDVLVALMGGAGVSLGIAASGLVSGRRWRWNIIGGAMGGLVVGAVVKVLGRDAFSLLFGQSPGDITGALPGRRTVQRMCRGRYRRVVTPVYGSNSRGVVVESPVAHVVQGTWRTRLTVPLASSPERVAQTRPSRIEQTGER